MNLKKLLSKPKTFHRLTGLSPEQFMRLASRVEPLFQQAEYQRKVRPGRQRKIGAGPKRKLSVPQALFGLFLYYRTYTNHVVEHVLAHLKKWQILAQRFRNSLDAYHPIFTNIALLYNYRLA